MRRPGERAEIGSFADHAAKNLQFIRHTMERSTTFSAVPGIGGAVPATDEEETESEQEGDWWGYGRWELGWWSPFDYRELRDDRVVYFATRIWRGSYTATYVARATTPGTFVRPPAHAEEMYNPAVFGRSDGGIFTVTKKQ